MCIEGYMQMCDGKYLVAFRMQIKSIGQLSKTQLKSKQWQFTLDISKQVSQDFLLIL